ncbi:cyclase family protein [Halorientalis regularis]|jgi:kynurenine formamidase|uniref:Kynurenine formamidase n=1 Tax=Halorientalis regularis TaxID=660518 RepID=A0A1G7N8X6_9EURY|nr:cyclase family protein [Halorientalis regularis]SDF70528.1 Kynurenine formamidase [Halorientalis regularis]
MARPRIEDVLDDAPDNWGRWGDDDELGAVNLLDAERVLRAVETVESGERYTLGVPLNAHGGDPVWPTRDGIDHRMVRDKSHIDAGEADREPFGGMESSDDAVDMFTHGTTHHDALGHSWYDDQLYNGFDAETTVGGLSRCGAEHLGEQGIVGRAVLLDVARHRGVDRLDRGDRITPAELDACADEQGVSLEAGDIVLVRTGALSLFYDEGPEAFYAAYSPPEDPDTLDEPGPTYTDETAAWFADNDVAVYGTDTLTAEQTHSRETDTLIPLHPALLRDLGVVITELLALEDLAAACADDGRYDCLFVSGPLPLVGGTGAPANPVVIR